MTICDPLRRTTPPDPRVHTPRLLSMILAAPGTVVGLGDTVDEELVDAVDEELVDGVDEEFVDVVDEELVEGVGVSVPSALMGPKDAHAPPNHRQALPPGATI